MEIEVRTILQAAETAEKKGFPEGGEPRVCHCSPCGSLASRSRIFVLVNRDGRERLHMRRLHMDDPRGDKYVAFSRTFERDRP